MTVERSLGPVPIVAWTCDTCGTTAGEIEAEVQVRLTRSERIGGPWTKSGDYAFTWTCTNEPYERGELVSPEGWYFLSYVRGQHIRPEGRWATRDYCPSCWPKALVAFDWAGATNLDAEYIERLESAVMAPLVFRHDMRPYVRKAWREIRSNDGRAVVNVNTNLERDDATYSDGTSTSYREAQPMELIDKSLVVHRIAHGVAICGMGPPERWPANHRWWWLDHVANWINCPGCLCSLPEHIHRMRREIFLACPKTLTARPGSDPSGSQLRCQLTKGHAGECAAGGP